MIKNWIKCFIVQFKNSVLAFRNLRLRFLNATSRILFRLSYLLYAPWVSEQACYSSIQIIRGWRYRLNQELKYIGQKPFFMLIPQSITIGVIFFVTYIYHQNTYFKMVVTAVKFLFYASSPVENEKKKTLKNVL